MASLFATMSTVQACLSRASHAETSGPRPAERLASGLRLNQARDDAAGLGIAERLTASIRAHGVIGRGLHDAISLVQQADSGLDQIALNLQRARELAIAAGNGALGESDRRHLQQEYAGRLQDIDAITVQDALFGSSLLHGQRASGRTPYLNEVFSASGQSRAMVSGLLPVAYIPAGMREVTLSLDALGIDDDLQLFTTDGRQVLGTGLQDRVWAQHGITDPEQLTRTVMHHDLGFQSGASSDGSLMLDGQTAFADPTVTTLHALPLTVQFAGMTIGYSGDGDLHDGGINDGRVAGGYRQEGLSIDVVTQPLLVMVVGAGNFITRGTWIEAEDGSTLPEQAQGHVDVVLQAPAGEALQSLRIHRMSADSAALGLTSSAIDSQEGALTSQALLDRAIDQVSEHRGRLGAHASRIERVLDQLGSTDSALQAARGRITDADLAREVAEQARQQIRTQAASAMLGQALQWPRQVLQLLRESL